MRFNFPKGFQTGVLIFILLSIPIATIINERVHNYQSAAHEKRAREEKIKISRKISGVIYEDNNENQIKEDGEQGIVGVEVIAKYRYKKIEDNDDDDNKNNDHRNRRENRWSEIKILSGQGGLFQIELPNNINPSASRFNLTVLPPSGYKLASTNFKHMKKQSRKKGEKTIYIGLTKDGVLPTSMVSDIPTVIPSVSPDMEINPTAIPTIVPTLPNPSPSQLPSHLDMSITPTIIVCPLPPVCEGEVVVIDQPSLVCPIYFCYSIDPGQ